VYAPLNIIKVIKSRRMGWAGHVARTGEMKNLCKVVVGSPEGRNHVEDLGEVG
jgi:hypothetical protein